LSPEIKCIFLQKIKASPLRPAFRSALFLVLRASVSALREAVAVAVAVVVAVVAVVVYR
jgi:hypothetical protein